MSRYHTYQHPVRKGDGGANLLQHRSLIPRFDGSEGTKHLESYERSLRDGELLTGADTGSSVEGKVFPPGVGMSC